MTTQALIDSWGQVGRTLILMVAMVVAADSLYSIADMHQTRVAANQEAQRIDGIKQAPVIAFFEYMSVEPVKSEIYSDEPVPMQSAAIIRQPVTILHDDRLMCRPIAGGSLRQTSKVHDTIRKYKPELIGPIDAPIGMEDARRRDGQWDYTGERPNYNATCYMHSKPCIRPHPKVEKCLPEIISGPVVIRQRSG